MRIRRVIATVCACAVLTTASNAQVRDGESSPALPPDASGQTIYRAACVTCHGADGRGSPSSVVGFALPLANGHSFPDFADCPTNTVEPSGDWMAVVHSGGPVRALDRHMPAFGDALSADQIERVVQYLWTFCRDRSWPRGDLNFPRGLFTEKAFPENEILFLTGSRPGRAGVTESLVYERRFGSRGTYEVNVPLALGQVEPGGPWRRGLGDVEITVRQTVHASVEHGSILALGGAVMLPTGKDSLGLGNGYSVFEPLLLAGQMLGANGFVQVQAGYEIASDRTRGVNEAFTRTALGYTWAQDAGRGRAWTPMAEVLVARPSRGPVEWDVVPQAQVSLSKLQHILVNVGVRMPLTQRDARKPQLMTYLLWDWFDGGLFEFWR
jgi:mono/diheme cytochrome c family protein